MMVMVEGRRPRCWGCKQIGHIAKFCPQRPDNKASTTTTTTDVAATTITINKEAEAKGPGQVQPKNNQEGWTEVTNKGKKVQLHPLLKNKPGPQQQQQQKQHRNHLKNFSQQSFPQKEKLTLLRKQTTRNYPSDRYSGQRLCALRSWRQLGTSSSGRH